MNGKRNLRNKAEFSNFIGVVLTGPHLKSFSNREVQNLTVITLT